MKLIYKIEYNSTSFYFKRLIDELIKNSNIDANTKQYFGFILIFIDDELENIEKFFLNLETNLPYSMFLKKSYLIDEFNDAIQELEDNNITKIYDGIVSHCEGAHSGGVFFLDPDGVRLEICIAEGIEKCNPEIKDHSYCGFF